MIIHLNNTYCYVCYLEVYVMVRWTCVSENISRQLAHPSSVADSLSFSLEKLLLLAVLVITLG